MRKKRFNNIRRKLSLDNKCMNRRQIASHSNPLKNSYLRKTIPHKRRSKTTHHNKQSRTNTTSSNSTTTIAITITSNPNNKSQQQLISNPQPLTNNNNNKGMGNKSTNSNRLQSLNNNTNNNSQSNNKEKNQLLLNTHQTPTETIFRNMTLLTKLLITILNLQTLNSKNNTNPRVGLIHGVRRRMTLVKRIIRRCLRLSRII